MILRSLASALPPHVFTQRACWERLQPHGLALGLRQRSMDLLEKILLGDSGIDQRHFAFSDPEEVFAMGAQQLNEAFEREATQLAAKALESALARGEIKASALDALFVCTCTGYLCPGISSHVAENLGLRTDTYLQDLVGLGCGATIPLLRSADAFLQTRDRPSVVATVSVEICSAAFYVDDDPGVLISLCLFGDGASASLWQNRSIDGAWATGRFDTLHRPEEREKIRFVNANGRLRNQLHRTVPDLAANAVKTLYDRCESEPNRVLSHTGGRDVVTALEKKLDGHTLIESRSVLRKYGNVSSPSVMLALEECLTKATDAEHLWAVSFGAGFAAHGCELHRQG